MPTAAQVSAVLDRAQVPHHALRPLAVQNNLSFTDDTQVFCKVARPGFDHAPLALELALAAHFQDGSMLEPLVSELLAVGSTYMSVWRWEPIRTFFSRDITAAEEDTAANLLRRFHAFSTPTTMRVPVLRSFDFLATKIDQRRTFAHVNGIPAHKTAPLREWYDRHLAGVQLNPDTQPFVLCHGDPHGGNLAWRARHERLSWIDYESAQLAPSEFDAAATQVYLRLLGQNQAAWEVAQAILYPGTDTELIKLFITARLLSMTSYGLFQLHARQEFETRMTLLNRFFASDELPTWFPVVV